MRTLTPRYLIALFVDFRSIRGWMEKKTLQNSVQSLKLEIDSNGHLNEIIGLSAELDILSSF